MFSAELGCLLNDLSKGRIPALHQRHRRDLQVFRAKRFVTCRRKIRRRLVVGERVSESVRSWHGCATAASCKGLPRRCSSTVRVCFLQRHRASLKCGWVGDANGGLAPIEAEPLRIGARRTAFDQRCFLKFARFVSTLRAAQFSRSWLSRNLPTPIGTAFSDGAALFI